MSSEEKNYFDMVIAIFIFLGVCWASTILQRKQTTNATF